MESKYSVPQIHKMLIEGKIELTDIPKYSDSIKTLAALVVNGKDVGSQTIADLIYVLLDYYTYGPGDVLVTDHTYDLIHLEYQRRGNAPIVYPDYCPTGKAWPIVKHTVPFMVGNVDKAYDDDTLEKEIRKRLASAGPNAKIKIAPKYDGISAVLTVNCTEKGFAIINGMTRNDGVYGQDITPLVRLANQDNVLYAVRDYLKRNNLEGVPTTLYVKVEIVMSTEDFNQLSRIKKYSNRRSAVAGIVNTPTNLDKAPYIILMPLKIARETNRGYIFDYVAGKAYAGDTVYDTIKRVKKLLDSIRMGDYQYRVDGVVIDCIDDTKAWYPGDAMENSIAYKLNSNIGVTTIEDHYVSVGRSGKATPMLKVADCDVNETIVHDVNVSNYAKFDKFEFRYGDMIEIESAGDVIPMVTRVIKHNKNGERIEPITRCPYCGKKLSHRKTAAGLSIDLYCTNDNCDRLIVGRVANFFVKIGAEGISDMTIKQIFDQYRYDMISDYVLICKERLSVLESWGDKKAQNYIDEVKRLRDVPLTYGTFLGALGIENVATKKCQKICKNISLDKLCLHAGLSNGLKKVRDDIMDIDGFGYDTAETIAKFFVDNNADINELMTLFTLIPDKEMIGNVVFTGFRDPDYEKEFLSLGYETSNSVNSRTMVVFAANVNSTKADAARRKGVPILSPDQMDTVLNALKRDLTPEEIRDRFNRYT